MSERTDFYDYLGEMFVEWVEHKIKLMMNDESQFDNDVQEEDYQELGLTKNKIQEEVIIPFKKYNYKQIQLICNDLTYNCQYLFKISKHNKMKSYAIQLIVLQVSEWGIFDKYYINKLKSECFKPKRQCFYCGKPIPEGLDSRMKYCHILEVNSEGEIDREESCPASEPNPQKHLRGCCFREWKIAKNKLPKQLETILKSKRYKTYKEKCFEALDILFDYCDFRYMRLIEKMEDEFEDYNFE